MYVNWFYFYHGFSLSEPKFSSKIINILFENTIDIIITQIRHVEVEVEVEADEQEGCNRICATLHR